VAVVLLSYDRPHLLRVALASLREQTCPRMSVLVVDNPGPRSEEIARLVTGEFPEFRLQRNSENVGYAAGMNSGIRNVEADYVYLTEDDIRLPPGAVEALRRTLEARPGRAMIGGLMVADADPSRIHLAGGALEMGSGFRLLHYYEPRPGVFRSDYISGNSLMVGSPFLRELGGFRDDFYMYLEDIELCCRARALGGEILVHGDVRIGDLGDPANTTARVHFHRMKNIGALYLLHAPAWVLPGFVLRTLGWNNFAALWRDRANVTVRLRALCWILANAPRLWRERAALISRGASLAR
jgi:glycosyltransferase involved in cell wall biosynthesis